MKFNWRIMRNGVYRYILLSYLAILLIALLTSALFMRQSEQILLKEMLNANMASMERLRQQIDDSMRDIESACVDNAVDQTLQKMVVNQHGTRTLNSYVDAVEIVKALALTKFNNTYIDCMYLMLFTDEYVLTDVGKYTIDEFYLKYYGGQQQMDVEQLLDRHRANRYKSYDILPIGENQRQPVFMYALPLSSPSDKTACLGVMLSRNVLSQMLNDGEWLPDAHVAILDADNRIIELWGNADETLLQQLDWGSAVDSGLNEHILDGELYYSMAIRSEVTPWCYVSLVPGYSYMDSRSQLVNVFAISLGMMLITGTGLAFVLSRRQYRPLRELISLTGQTEEPSKGQDEYSIIARSIRKFKSENLLLTRINKTQSEVLRSQYIDEILKGTLVDDCEIKNMLRDCGMSLRYARFAVAYADARDWNAYRRMQPSGAAALPDENTYLNFIAEQARCFAPPEADVLSTIVDSTLYMLINCAFDDVSTVRSWYEKAFAACMEQFGYRVPMGVSELHGDCADIHAAYLEAEAVREYQQITGMGGVRCKCELPEHTVDGQVVGLLEAQKLVGMLQAGQFEDARKLFNQVLDEKFYKCALPAQAMTCGLYGLICTLMNAFAECETLSSATYSNGIEPVERLMHCGNVQSLQREMNRLLDDLCAQPSKPDKTRIDAVALTEDAVALIEQRYADQMLSVAMVAEDLNVNPVQLTRAFKKVLNVNVLDYIHMSRLFIAKQLLLSSDESIASIAQRTGYNNNVTFIRVFKKYEEITPSQYRAQHMERPE